MPSLIALLPRRTPHDLPAAAPANASASFYTLRALRLVRASHAACAMSSKTWRPVTLIYLMKTQT